MAYLYRWDDKAGELALGITSDGLIETGVKNNAGWTPVGGLYVRMQNKTGSASVKGTLVTTGSESMSFVAVTGGVPNCMGIVYDAGVADGSVCRVVVAGIAQVLFKDGEAPVVGYWCGNSVDTAGRAEAKESLPDNSGAGVTLHNREIGHILETKEAGTDVLARVVLHFN